MKLLITGGGGFIGTNLIAHLAETGGYDVAVLDNESLGSRAAVEPFGVDFIHGSILNDDDLAAAISGRDVVVHLAADTRVMDSIENPAHNFETNVVGTFRVLQAARAHSVSRIVNASTGGAILGEANAPVNETMVANPLSAYGASKLSAEGYMNAFGASYGLKTISLRFSNIFGPYSFHKGSVVAHFIRKILRGEELVVYGDGSQVRDYLFSGDLAEGIRKALHSDATGVFQLGSNTPTSLNELIAELKGVIGRDDIPVRYEDFRVVEIHTTWCDTSKARKTFDFAAPTPLADGLARTWDWFHAAGPSDTARMQNFG